MSPGGFGIGVVGGFYFRVNSWSFWRFDWGIGFLVCGGGLRGYEEMEMEVGNS